MIGTGYCLPCVLCSGMQAHQTLSNQYFPRLGGGLIGYVKSKPLGNGQIISIDVLVIVMIIAVFHRKLI